jgi:hypothetical protein
MSTRPSSISSLSACLAAALFAASCGSGSGSASSSPSPSAAPAQTALPSGTKTPVTFSFSDIAVAAGGSNTLRLGFTIVNATDDPQLCDSSEFSIQLSDGTVIAADDSADNTCTPNTVDPRSTGTATMYFDLPHPYAGDVTMMMNIDGNIIGQGTATVH